MASPAPMGHADIIYPSGLKLALMMFVFVGMFPRVPCASEVAGSSYIPSIPSIPHIHATDRPCLQRCLQDRLIILTAIPHITNESNSAGDVGWYSTAYLLTNCAFQLVSGKLFKILSVRAIFLISMLLFEAGSALCGAALNLVAFILGRAIAGLGSRGILSGVIRCISLLLNHHPSTTLPLSSLLHLFR